MCESSLHKQRSVYITGAFKLVHMYTQQKTFLCLQNIQYYTHTHTHIAEYRSIYTLHFPMTNCKKSRDFQLYFWLATHTSCSGTH